MAPSYRVALVAPGHPCALWVTGSSGGGHTPGVWAIGEVTSEPYDDTGDPADDLWLDVGARQQVRPHVMVDLRVLESPLPRSVLRADPRFADSEILVAPRVASPVAVRPEEWAAILDLDPGVGPGFRPQDQAQ
jgi:predicted RNA-binding protein with PUA-like domain